MPLYSSPSKVARQRAADALWPPSTPLVAAAIRAEQEAVQVARRAALERRAVHLAVDEERDVAVEHAALAAGDAVAQVVADDSAPSVVPPSGGSARSPSRAACSPAARATRRASTCRRAAPSASAGSCGGERLAEHHVARAVARDRLAGLIDDHDDVGAAATAARRIAEPRRGRLGGVVGARAAAVEVEPAEHVAQLALGGALRDQVEELERRRAATSDRTTRDRC